MDAHNCAYRERAKTYSRMCRESSDSHLKAALSKMVTGQLIQCLRKCFGDWRVQEEA
jgi:hypothetical protein